MSAQIKDLVNMRDFESLYEILSDDDDWMNRMDAAEGLVRLGDRRGLDFLLDAVHSEYKEMRQVAGEILESPEIKRMRDEIDVERRRARETHLADAKVRLQKGRKVFRYKTLFLPAEDILGSDASGDGGELPELDEAGLEGWEVVTAIPRRGQLLVGNVDENFVGMYFLLKRELTAEDAAELNQI